MARSRNIKPGFYRNEQLAECSVWARFIFPGLWMMADRDGRLEDRPKRIQSELLAYDGLSVLPLLGELATHGFIIRYEVNGARYIQITNFDKHQNPHQRETPSKIPPVPGREADNGAKAQPRHELDDDSISVEKHNLGTNSDAVHEPYNDAEAEPRHDQSTALAQPEHSLGNGEAQPRYDPGTALAEPRHDLGDAEAQPRHGRARLIPDSSPLRVEVISPPSLRSGVEITRRPRGDQPALALVDVPNPKPNPKPKTTGPPDCPHLTILALWAEVLPAMPSHDAGQWRGARAAHLRARWRETAVAKRWQSADDGLGYFRKLFAYVGQSPFLTGRIRPRDDSRPPFCVTLAWLVSPENWAKTVEGSYHRDSA